MKKSYLTLGALAMIMASCSNEVLVDNESGQTDVAIGFSTFSDKATKALQEENLEKYHQTMSIYGTKKSVNDQSVSRVFDAVVATYSSAANAIPNEWTYSPLRYWDNQASYAFAAVAPSNAIINFNLANDETMVAALTTDGTDFVGSYTLKGQNLQSTATTAEKKVGFWGPSAVNNTSTDDTDILTSDVITRAAKNHDMVDFTFKHILAKLNVSIGKSKVLDDAVVTIESVTITGLNPTGTYAESKYAAPSTSGWSEVKGASDSYKLAYSGSQILISGSTSGEPATWTAGAPYYFIESLVMPQSVAATCKITIEYSIKTGTGTDTYTEKYKYVVDLDDAFASFMDRCNYLIKFTIDPDVITFDAKAYVWDDKVTKEIDIE